MRLAVCQAAGTGSGRLLERDSYWAALLANLSASKVVRCIDSIKFMANFCKVGFYVIEPSFCIVDVLFEYCDRIVASIAAQGV